MKVFYKFTVASEHSIRYGLGAIKGVGEAAIEMIIDKRRVQTFRSLKDFCSQWICVKLIVEF